MQLIWVSGPTGRVVTLSITRRKVLTALALGAAGLFVLGGLLQLIGLRVAVEHVPTLAHKMGGVASLQEQQRLEASYTEQLARLQRQLEQTVERVQQMDAHRQAFFSRIGLDALLQPAVRAGKDLAGRGCPLRSLAFWPQPASLQEGFVRTSQTMDEVHRSVEQSHEAWSRLQERLARLPLALPLQDEFLLTSQFGVRPDPLTHLPAMHEGIDFVAPVGTPVLATAAGQVVQAQFSGAYGNLVEVAHAEGFVTRYAHLSAMLVRPGQTVRAGERLGLLGNTGRSTGPHLHYEVLYQGRPMHPVKALQAWSRS